jgi:FkbM family methyltransferase
MIDFFRHGAFADVFADAGLVAIDIGARGGFEADLLPIAWAVDAHGFEPEPEAYSHLSEDRAGPWRNLAVHRLAIAGSSGDRRLHIPSDPQGASLLEHDPAIGRRFGYPQLFDLARTETIATTTLDEAATRFGLDAAAYLKLDVEGAEMEVLQAGETVVASLVAIKTEAAFLPFRKNQPLAWDLAAHLGARGFEIMDVSEPHRWRHGPAAPHPYLRRQPPAYSRGQAVQCDLLFFRAAAGMADDDQAVRGALIALALGYFDHAASLFAALADRRRLEFDVSREIAELSRRYGRRQAAGAIKAHLRDLIPLIRSLTVGLPR